MVELTKGKITPALIKFSVPLLISVAFQQMYNICDSVIAGKFAGENALAAVGASYPITMIFMAFAVGCNIGSSVIVSQLFGSRKLTRMKTAVNTALVMTLVLSIFLAGVGLVFCDGMLKLLDTPKNIFDDGSAYLGIYTLGLPLLFMYNIASGIFTAIGDSKTPLYLLIFSSVLNIILDLVFVIVFEWGVRGVGWATFIAQGLASILSLIVVFVKIKKIKCEHKPKIFDLSIFSRIVTVTVPSILQQSFVSVGNLFIQTLINSYGSSVVAGYSAAIKLNTFGIMSFAALGNAMSSFTAQNIGAKQLPRIKKGFKSSVAICACVVIPFTALFLLAPEFFLGLFMKKGESAEAIKVGCTFLRIASPFYIVISMKLLCDGVLRGAGAMKTFMVATFTDLIIRVVLSFVLSDLLNSSTGIWLSWPVGWTVSAIMSLVFYFKNLWVPRGFLSFKENSDEHNS
ncbi:MAG: MATE family efflux transporter [Oscillospiraceae bacterium]|nr:MATE family efflux transporter [Oscillospiraceae bacterium]MBQ8378742.1 MATE family efflux transporter [Oscillospiraceae bacterium]